MVFARIASVASAASGIAVGLYVLFGPTYTRCSFGRIGQSGIGQPVVTLEPARCETVGMVVAQPVWPLPLLALAFWSLVPLIAVAGAWQGRRSIVLASVLLEMSAIISFGAAPYYLPFVAVPLVITWLLTRGGRTARTTALA